MKNKLILVLIIAILVGLHLFPLIPPEVEVPNIDNINDASIEKANNLYQSANYTEAVRYYYVLAKQGNSHAQYRTGILYLQGKGIKKDRCESTYWFDKSAREGSISAQYQLGRSYYHGYGVEKDNTLAYFWIKTAIEAAPKEFDAIDSIKSIYSEIQEVLKNADELESAIQQFQSWKYSQQKPVEITRLRKFPVFDQFMSEIFDTLPCK